MNIKLFKYSNILSIFKNKFKPWKYFQIFSNSYTWNILKFSLFFFQNVKIMLNIGQYFEILILWKFIKEWEFFSLSLLVLFGEWRLKSCRLIRSYFRSTLWSNPIPTKSKSVPNILLFRICLSFMSYTYMKPVKPFVEIVNWKW